jgi:hypothetical protein
VLVNLSGTPEVNNHKKPSTCGPVEHSICGPCGARRSPA